PDNPAAHDVDPIDDLVGFVIGNDRPAVRRNERIVGGELLALRQAASRRKLPENPVGLVDDDETAIAAVCDQEPASEAPRGRESGGRWRVGRRGSSGRCWV